METTKTRAGSRVEIYKKTPEYIIGAWDDGTGVMYPIRWQPDGKLWPKGEYECSLDLCLPA